jgi:hypothetical protein
LAAEPERAAGNRFAYGGNRRQQPEKRPQRPEIECAQILKKLDGLSGHDERVMKLRAELKTLGTNLKAAERIIGSAEQELRQHGMY